MSINNVGKSKADISQLKAGMELKTVKQDTKMESVFNAIDKNKNGVLEEEELNKFKENFDKDGNNVATKKEARKFIKENNLKEQNIKKKDVIRFLQEYGENTENVKETEVLDDGKVSITYNDGTKKVIAQDKSYDTIETKDDTTETKSYDSNDVLQKEKIETQDKTTTNIYDKDGKTITKTTEENRKENITTETEYNSQGEKVESKITSGKDGSVATVKYQNNEPASKEVVLGDNVSNYEYVNGKERIISKISNKGNDVLEKKHDYKYNEDGSYTEEITQNGKQNHTTNKCNSDGHRTEQTKTVGSKEYKASYDGQGNTTGIVIQNRENISQIAQKFGCSVEDLKRLNGKEKFAVGDTIKVPGEHEADKPELQNRKSPEEAKAEFQRDERIRTQKEAQRQAAIAQRQAAIAQRQAQRALENAKLKTLGLKDRKGAGTKVTGHFANTGRKLTLTKVGNAAYERNICKDNKGNYYVVAKDGVILKESYVKTSTIYAGSKKVTGKVRDKNGKMVNKEYAEIPGVPKDAHGRKLVMDKFGKAYYMAQDGTILKEEYIAKSNRADKIVSNSKTAKAETLNMLNEQIENAEAAFNQQMKDDGWAGDVADGISVLWGSKNRASIVRKEMAEFKRDIAELKKCKTDAEFSAKFKQKFGVPYNAKAIADYMRNPSSANYRKAFGTKRDIGTRVAKYNESQQQGAAYVKTGAKIGTVLAVTVATGGAGGIVGAAALTGGASLLVEETDRMNITGEYKDANGKTVKSQGTFREGTDHLQILEDAALDAGAVLVGGAVGKGAQTLVKGTKVATAAGGTAEVLSRGQKIARAGITMTGDVAYGAAQDYIKTGEITATGVITNAAMSGIGSAVQLGGAKYVKEKAKGAYNKLRGKNADVDISTPKVKIKGVEPPEVKVKGVEPPEVKISGGKPKTPEVEVGGGKPKTPEVEVGGGKPKTPEVEVGGGKPKTPEVEVGGGKPKTPEVEVGGGKPKTPEVEVGGGKPKTPEVEVGGGKPKTPEVEVGGGKPKTPEVEKPQGVKSGSKIKETPEVVVLETPKNGSLTIEKLLHEKNWDRAPKLQQRFKDLNQTLSLVEDETARNYIEKELSQIAKSINKNGYVDYKKLKELEDLTDAINAFNNHYSVYRQYNDIGGKSAMARFSKFVQKADGSIDEVLHATDNMPLSIKKRANLKLLQEDLARENRIYGIRQYMKHYPNTEISDMLYDKYYLTMWENNSINPEVMKQATDRCREINAKFGVKILMPSRLSKQNFDEVADYIEGEMSQWAKASGGKAKLPATMDFSSGKADWYDDLAANGQSVSGAYSESHTGSLAFPRMDKRTVAYSLRHEMTHSNDLKQGMNIPSKYNLNEIMPKKQLIKNGVPVVRDGKPVMVPDFEHCKFTEEFEKIGIPKWHIPYAYSNPKEFIAVASEGDLSKCSPEFRQMLIDFGMPEWRFNFNTQKESLISKFQSDLKRLRPEVAANIQTTTGTNTINSNTYSEATTRILSGSPTTRIKAPDLHRAVSESIVMNAGKKVLKEVKKEVKKEIKTYLADNDNDNNKEDESIT